MVGGWNCLSSRNKTSVNPFTSFKGSHYLTPKSPHSIPCQDFRLAGQLHHRECQVIGRRLMACRNGEGQFHTGRPGCCWPGPPASETLSMWWQFRSSHLPPASALHVQIGRREAAHPQIPCARQSKSNKRHLLPGIWFLHPKSSLWGTWVVQ